MESEAIEYPYIPRIPQNACQTRISPAQYEMWESSRYNEVRNLCYNDPKAWHTCVRIARDPYPVTQHFVRRSKRLMTGPVQCLCWCLDSHLLPGPPSFRFHDWFQCCCGIRERSLLASRNGKLLDLERRRQDCVMIFFWRSLLM